MLWHAFSITYLEVTVSMSIHWSLRFFSHHYQNCTCWQLEKQIDHNHSQPLRTKSSCQAPGLVRPAHRSPSRSPCRSRQKHHLPSICGEALVSNGAFNRCLYLFVLIWFGLSFEASPSFIGDFLGICWFHGIILVLQSGELNVLAGLVMLCYQICPANLSKWVAGF